MNARFWIAAVAMFVLSLGLGFVIHAGLLESEYSRLPGLFRSKETQGSYFPFMLVAHALIACGFVWIYRMGREADKPWIAQGLRFGAAIIVLTTIPTYLIYFAVQPMPWTMVTKQIIFDALGVLIMAITLAWIYRGEG